MFVNVICPTKVRAAAGTVLHNATGTVPDGDHVWGLCHVHASSLQLTSYHFELCKHMLVVFPVTPLFSLSHILMCT